MAGSDLKASVSTAGSHTQGKIEKLETKLSILEKSISKINKENEVLSQALKSSKRAGTVLGLEKEMERQDIVIEILRERIALDKGDKFVEMKQATDMTERGFTKLSAIDRELINQLDKGPKRIRPPTREELYIQLRSVFSEYKDIETKYFKLFPGRNSENYRSKGVQTEGDILAIETQVDMQGMDSNLSKADAAARIKIEKLKQNLEIQTDAIAKLKTLIQSRASDTKKMRSLQEDYENLLSEVAEKKSAKERYRAQNEDLSRKIDNIAKANTLGIDALREQEKLLLSRIAMVKGENNKIEDGVKGILSQLGNLASADGIESLLEKLSVAKKVSREQEETINKLKGIQQEKETEKIKVESLTTNVEKEVHAIRDSLSNEVQNAVLGVAEQKELEMDVDWEINSLKKRIRSERLKEVQELAQLEEMEAQLKQLLDKNSALAIAAKYLGGTGTAFQGIENEQQQKLKDEFRLEYEGRLNKRILIHTELSKKVQQAQDYLYLLEDSPAVDLAELGSVNSKIESIRTFKVYQPDERPVFQAQRGTRPKSVNK